MKDLKRYSGYVVVKEEVLEVLEWIDRELLGGKWLITRWDAQKGVYGMGHTYIVRFRYGGVNKVRVRGKTDGDWDEMELGMWERCMEMDKGRLTDEDWEWVREMRAKCNVEMKEVKSRCKGASVWDL